MLYEAEAGNISIVASGDTMITRQLSVFRESRFTELFDLFREADVGFTNLEMLMHDFEHSTGMAGGTFTGSDPNNLEELIWGGINLVSCANNHSFDYGEQGVLTNLRHIKKSRLAFAGSGRNLSEARAPGYIDTPNGRVALLSASSTFAEPGRALDQRPDLLGRPGLNALRFNTTRTVDKESFDVLKRTSTKLGLEAQKDALRRFRPRGSVSEDSDTTLSFLGNRFALGDEFKTSTSPNTRDMEDNLKWIRDARHMADWVLVSVHCHESGVTRDEPPDFLKTFAKACIDQGADMFIGHGPHFTKGIEIYRGKPIFYSLGNFIFQNDTVKWQPSFNYDTVKLEYSSTPGEFYEARSESDTRGFPADPIYWESIVIKTIFEGGKLSKITLHPIDIGFGKPRSQRGRPVLADSDLGEKVLNRVKRLSVPFGTDIQISNNIGVVSLS